MRSAMPSTGSKAKSECAASWVFSHWPRSTALRRSMRPAPLYRETHALLDDLAEATLDGTRKEHMEFLVTVPLLILDDLGMRKLPLTAAEELLEIIMRRYERASTMLTSNRLCSALHNRFNAESSFMRRAVQREWKPGFLLRV